MMKKNTDGRIIKVTIELETTSIYEETFLTWQKKAWERLKAFHPDTKDTYFSCRGKKTEEVLYTRRLFAHYVEVAIFIGVVLLLGYSISSI